MKNRSKKEKIMVKYEIDVQGMSCGHCVARVEAALKPLTSSAKVDLNAGLATVETDRPAEELLAALDTAGYPGVIRK